MKATLLTCFISILTLLHAYAEDGGVKIYGKTLLMQMPDGSSKAEGFVNISVYQDSNLLQSIQSSSNGRYQIILPANGKYMLVFGSESNISKAFELSTEGMSAETNFPQLKMDVTIIEDDGTDDFQFLRAEAIARIYYDPAYGHMVFDSDYTENMYNRFMAVLNTKVRSN